jgi:hypothetical protein
VGRGENVFFLHLTTKLWNIPLAIKLGTFHWPPSLEPSIDHQTLEHSIGHQALDLPSPPFSFSLKGKFGSLGAFYFLGHNFQLNLEKTCSYKLFEEEKNDQPW